MKSTSTLLLSALALGVSSLIATAQDAPGQRPQGGPGGRPGSPIVAALDANKDGEIDATELANAVTALKALDKNSDGKLSGDEIRPARGDRGPRGAGGGPDREQRGPGGPGGEKKSVQ